jgi:hypothetical protein
MFSEGKTLSPRHIFRDTGPQLRHVAAGRAVARQDDVAARAWGKHRCASISQRPSSRPFVAGGQRGIGWIFVWQRTFFRAPILPAEAVPLARRRRGPFQIGSGEDRRGNDDSDGDESRGDRSREGYLGGRSLCSACDVWGLFHNEGSLELASAMAAAAATNAPPRAGGGRRVRPIQSPPRPSVKKCGRCARLQRSARRAWYRI